MEQNKSAGFGEACPCGPEAHSKTLCSKLTIKMKKKTKKSNNMQEIGIALGIGNEIIEELKKRHPEEFENDET